MYLKQAEIQHLCYYKFSKKEHKPIHGTNVQIFYEKTEGQHSVLFFEPWKTILFY